VAHTAFARNVLGPDRLLVPHQAFLLEPDPVRARATVRLLMGPILDRPDSPYVRNLRRLGFGSEDTAAGGSDRLVAAVVAWGDEAAVQCRVREHLDAGADHVLVHALAPGLPEAVDQLERLAPAVL